MKFWKIFSLIATLFMTACSTKATNPNVDVVSPQVFNSKLIEDSTAYLLDVRKPDEFAAGHIAGAHLLNWLDFATFKNDAKNLNKANTIYVYCRSGRRSNEAANYLAEQGYKMIDMAGGILAWEKDGLPVTTGEPNDFSDRDMLIRISEITVSPEHLSEYLEFAKNVGQESVEKEPGVICIFPMIQQRDSCQIRILEIYRDQDSYQSHLQTPWFQTYKQGTLHMVKSLDLVDMTAMNPAAMPKIFLKMNNLK